MPLLLLTVVSAVVALWLRRIGRTIEESLPRAGTRAMIRRVAALAVCRYLAALSTFATISAAVVLIFVAVLNVASRTSFVATTSFLTSLRSIHASVEKIDAAWNLAILALLVPIFLIVVYRSERKRVDRHFDDAARVAVEQLFAARAAGAWEVMESTDAMRELERRIADLEKELSATGPAPAISPRYKLTHQQILEIRQNLFEKHFLLDVDRRVRAELDLHHLVSPEPSAGRWGRIRTFFVSDGLLKTLSFGTKVVLAAGMLLIVPTLVGVEMRGARQPIDVALWRLTVNATRAEAERSIEQAMQDPPPPPVRGEGEVSDDQAIEMIARHYEASWQSAQVWSNDSKTTTRAGTPTPADARANEVRREILKEWATAARKAGVDVDAARAEGVTDIYTATMDRARSEEPPLGATGRSMVEKLTKLKRDVAAWKRVKASVKDYKASFQRVGERRTMMSLLMATAFDQAAECIVDPKTAMSAIATDLFTEGTPAVIQAASEVRANEYLATLIRGRGLDAAADAVAHSSSARHFAADVNRAVGRAGLTEARAVLAQLADTPSLQAREIERLTEVKQRLELLTRGRPSRRAVMADALSTFEDLFPGSNRTATKTVRYEALTSWTSAPDSSTAIGAARDATLLHGSRKIGGVLIGIQPSQPAIPLDFVKMTWTTTEDLVTFALTRGDGKQFSVSPFRRSIAAQALAYAADGRPTAVTLKENVELGATRVLLHPVLIDSPLGCGTILVDNLIFDRVNTDGETNAARLQEDLYRLAVAVASGRYIDANLIRKELESKDVAAGLRSMFDTPSRSPVVSKSQHYEPRVVVGMKACRFSATAEAFETCLLKRGPADSTLEGHSAPDMQFRSGVRETAFAPDPELAFLNRSGTTEMDRDLRPFNFILLAVFAEADSDPFEFTWMREQIAQTIRRVARDEPEVCAALRDLQEFAIAQRLFRTILAGKFGRRFPVETLGELSRAIMPTGVVRAPTPRWIETQELEDTPDFDLAVIDARRALGIEDEARTPTACGKTVGASLTSPVCR